MATVDHAQAPSHAASAAEKTRRPGLRRAGGNLVRVLLVGFFAFPLLFIFMSSLKPDDQIFADLDSIKAFLPVGDISLSSYTGVFETVPAARFLANAFFIYLFYSYFQQLKVLWGQIMAYSAIITIPVLVMFLALQRQFIRSIASAGVKG